MFENSGVAVRVPGDVGDDDISVNDLSPQAHNLYTHLSNKINSSARVIGFKAGKLFDYVIEAAEAGFDCAKVSEDFHAATIGMQAKMSAIGARHLVGAFSLR